jgi:glycosyltransferase involved in cell wall biosynthesis
MKIYYDVTKARSSRHVSGLIRVSRRLLAELKALPGVEVSTVVWSENKCCLVDAHRSRRSQPGHDEHYFIPELFSEKERPGFGQFLDDAPFHTVALYHDAIPLKFPEHTWPRSVERHPSYLKSLASFQRVLAVSEHSRRELETYWDWLAIEASPPVGRIVLGADFLCQGPEAGDNNLTTERLVLAVGILEPRKNQALLLEVSERLWRESEKFSLVLVGRENPHFSKFLVQKIRVLQRAGRPLEHRKAVNDEALVALYRRALFSVFPSRFEGYGLPVQESLWAGTPCICSDIAGLRECSQGGGCLEFCSNDTDSLYDAMKLLLTDESSRQRLHGEITKRNLPTWRSTARQLVDVLKESTGSSTTDCSNRLPTP